MQQLAACLFFLVWARLSSVIEAIGSIGDALSFPPTPQKERSQKATPQKVEQKSALGTLTPPTRPTPAAAKGSPKGPLWTFDSGVQRRLKTISKRPAKLSVAAAKKVQKRGRKLKLEGVFPQGKRRVYRRRGDASSHSLKPKANAPAPALPSFRYKVTCYRHPSDQTHSVEDEIRGIGQCNKHCLRKMQGISKLKPSQRNLGFRDRHSDFGANATHVFRNLLTTQSFRKRAAHLCSFPLSNAASSILI